MKQLLKICGVIFGVVILMIVLQNKKKQENNVKKSSNIVSYERFVDKKIEELIREIEGNG